MTSRYIVNCPEDGERATVSFTAYGYELECPQCHRAEYGETLEKAVRCFEVPNAEPRR